MNTAPRNATNLPEHMLCADDPFDRIVMENCHPPQYVNPTPTGKYNLIAIGAGAAGLVSSGGAGSLGAKAALIERALTGGDCLNTGCVPSKGVIRAARAIFDLRTALEFGITWPAEPQINFAAAMERMRRLRARISAVDAVARFSDKYNVDVYLGDAQFISPTAIEVAGQRLEFNRAVIATGGRATVPAIPGLQEVGCYTNETIFNLTELPRRLVVIGGGPVGCELAQSFQRFGSTVTILDEAARLLPREDPDASALLERQFAREGITLLTRTRIQRVEKRGADKLLWYERGGQQADIVCDAILCAAGRVPNLAGLNLEAAGVRYDHTGVLVDDRLRTSNPRIFAAGDVCSKHKFTHAADATARLVIRNALFFGRNKASSLVMPWCTYTDPEIAHVGYYEADARAAGFAAATITEDFADLDRAILDGEDEGFARVHYDRQSGQMLGGTIVARHAGELISELTLAITHNLTLGALSTTIHPYPTQAEVLRKLGDAYNRARLTPTLHKLFKKWFEWRR
jgi:pyruvate/2-oxoglutarate dehydrogenase complex dihydrolipoamide dehydrogenase (E3) component